MLMERPRMFDHEQASRRHAAGETLVALAAEYGVSSTGVYLAINPVARARTSAYSAAWQKEGTCPDCGGKATRHHLNDTHRCRSCAAKRAAVSVRPDSLQCTRCQDWKPDGAFPAGPYKHRRGRRKECRACLTVMRREYRERNKVPCSHGCGAMVLHERRNRDKPHECSSCATTRRWAETRAAA